MERDMWRLVAAALRRLPRTCVRGQRYSSADVLAVLLWAALHDRSILWACQRCNWPMQAWRRRLPDQSTMSRRLREPCLLHDLQRLVDLLQPGHGDADNTLLRVDGKPLGVSNFSADADARKGWGAGISARGYKLHALVASARRLVGCIVEPMNIAECTTAQRLLDDAAARGQIPADTLVLADASYDSNPLHEAAARHGAQLLAPRRRPGTGFANGQPQSPGRVLSTLLLEGDSELSRWQRRQRVAVEHYFAGLTATGLHTLPPWVRTLPRVRVWVYAKLAINAARIARHREHVA